MAMGENPLSIEVLGELSRDDLSEDIEELTQAIEREEGGRGEWVSNLRTIRELIDGKQKRKNEPWKGASNVCIPLIKKLLRRWKPLLYNLFALADPVCSFEATSLQGVNEAPKAERFFDWLTKVYMDDVDEQIQLLTEYIGRDGSGYMGVGWDWRTELDTRIINIDNLFPNGITDGGQFMRTVAMQYELDLTNPRIINLLREVFQKVAQGHKFIRISYRRVTKNKPKVVAYDPTKVTVPAHSGSAEEAPWVSISHEFTADELRKKAQDGFFRKDKVEELLSHDTDAKDNRTTSGQYNDNKRLQDIGVNTNNDSYKARQVYCWLDWNRDGVTERTIMWISQDTEGSPIILAIFPFALSMTYWPIFRFDYEKTANGPYISQGMGHMVQPLQEQLNKQYRAKSDAIDIQLAPVFEKRITGGIRSRNIKWGPGQVIDVQQVGDFAEVKKNPMELREYINAEAQIENYADTLVGSLVNDLQATGRKLERRTATEVKQVSGTSEAMNSLDAASFQGSMRKVWQAVWQLWLDLGPREIYFTVTGSKTPELFKKADYDKNYQLMPTGTPGNTDRNKQLSYVMQLLEMAMQDPTGSFNIPALLQIATKLIDDRLVKAVLMPQAHRQALQTIQKAAALINAGDVPPDVQSMISSGAGNMENRG